MAVRTVGRRKITLTLSSTVPTPISASNLFTPDMEIYFPDGNTGLYGYVGDSTVDNTWIPRVKDVPYNYASGTGSMGGTIPEIGFNLAMMYVLGTVDGDTAIVEYMYYDRSTK